MKQSALMCLATVAWAPWAVAGLFDEVRPHATNYEYFQAGYVSQPNDFEGMELGASMPFASNVAFIGRLSVPSATIDGSTVESQRIEVGTRYFFGMPNLDDTDADLAVSFANTDLSGGGYNDSESGLLVHGQLRRAMNSPIGTSQFAISEAYGGAQMWLGDQVARSVHAGLLVDLNDTVSANAEVLYDEGAQVRVGIRMDLAKPGAPRRAALIQTPSEKAALAVDVPATAALEDAPSDTTENGFVSFIRNLFRQGPEAVDAQEQPTAEDGTVGEDDLLPLDEEAVEVELIKPATGALSVYGTGAGFDN